MTTYHVHCNDCLTKVNGITSNRTPARYNYKNSEKKCIMQFFSING